MFRRRVAGFLILLVLQPWHSCAHAHSGVSEHDPSGKVRPPHFHLRFLYVAVRSPSESPARPAGHPAVSGGTDARDHDADAIYVPISVLLGWDDGPQGGSPVPPPGLASGASAFQAFVADANRSRASGVWNDPEPTCPVRLRTFVLLI
jgi:hypothetical protein